MREEPSSMPIMKTIGTRGFGRVQRHERHAVILDVGVVDVGDERELREEGLEVRVLLRLLEVTRDADELLEVLDARLVLRFLVCLELIDVARLFEDPVDEIVELHVHVGVHEVEDEGREELEWLLTRAVMPGMASRLPGLASDVEERELLFLGKGSEAWPSSSRRGRASAH